MSKTITGDIDEDLGNLIWAMVGFREVYDEFDAIPSADNVSDLSSWTQALYARCDEIESHYGTRQGNEMIQEAWEEAGT